MDDDGEVGRCIYEEGGTRRGGRLDDNDRLMTIRGDDAGVRRMLAYRFSLRLTRYT